MLQSSVAKGFGKLCSWPFTLWPAAWIALCNSGGGKPVSHLFSGKNSAAM
jgi:hypothetical protein